MADLKREGVAELESRSGSDVTVSDKNKVKGFFSMFDQVHSSKAALVPASALQK